MAAPLSEPLLQGAGGASATNPGGRDLEAARSAYNEGDIRASIAAHQAGAALNGTAPEHHIEAGGGAKSVVFGGLDGILTSFAIVAGAVGAGLPPVAILAMGFSNVIADAISLGAGEYLSSRAYNDYVKKEMEREKWELENYPEGEMVEMIELFQRRGMSREDAEEVIVRMAKYKNFFINLMMTEELALPIPADDADAGVIQDGAIMFVAFAGFGMIPILVFILMPIVQGPMRSNQIFPICSLVTCLALMLLGAFKAKYTCNDKRFLQSGLQTLLLGGGCACVSYGIGHAVNSFAEESFGSLYLPHHTQ